MINTDSLLEIAIQLLKSKKKEKTLDYIVKEAMSIKGLSEEEAKECKAQFILDFMASGYFVYCGNDKWDLKDRQPLEVLEKEGAGYADNKEQEDEATQHELHDENEVDSEDNQEDENDEEDDNDSNEEDDLSKEFDPDKPDDLDEVKYYDSDEDDSEDFE